MNTHHDRSFTGLTMLAFALLLALISWRAEAGMTARALEVATGWDIVALEEHGGVAIIASEEVAFSILGSVAFSHEGKEWWANVLRFPQAEMDAAALEKVLTGGPCLGTLRPRVVLATADGTEGCSVELDPDVVASHSVSDLAFGDFIGTGHELSLNATLSFCDPPQRRVIEARRRYLFAFPSLEPLMALDERVLVRTAEGEKESIQYVYPYASARMVIQRAPDFRPTTISRRDPVSKRIRKVDPNAPPVLPRDTDPAKLRARLVNEEGEPLSGARIEYQLCRTPPPILEPVIAEGATSTNENGYFEIPTDHGLAFTAKLHGYYDVVRSFHLLRYEDVKGFKGDEPYPEDVITIEMMREQPEVEVWDSHFGIPKTYENPSSQHTFAIKFYPDRADNRNNPVDADAIADVVFDLSRDCEDATENIRPNVCVWSVTVRGQHGWELLPADRPNIRRTAAKKAPENGYKDQWHFLDSELPSMFYLRKDGGERYGVIDFIRVVEQPGKRSTLTDNRLEVECGYVVQARPQGTRSLVHRLKRSTVSID